MLHSSQPRLIPFATRSNSAEAQVTHTNLTTLPDFKVVLSIDETRVNLSETTPLPHEIERFISLDYYLLLEEHYRKLATVVTLLTGFSHLLTIVFILCSLILIFLVIFFLYTLCHHLQHRAARRSPSLI